MKTKKLTHVESMRLLRAVRRISSGWNRHGMADAIEMIITLTDMLDGHRFDLLAEDGQRLREATVTETVDSMISPDGFITVDNATCWVDC